MMSAMADMVTSMGVTHVKCSKSDSVIYKLCFVTRGVVPQISQIDTDRHMTLLFFNDTRDNRNNGKNGRNVVCHEVT